MYNLTIEWIIFEIFINIVEVGTVFYLLCKTFPAKYNTVLPTLLFMAGNITYLSLSLFYYDYMPSAELITFISFLVYTLLFRNGRLWKKIFWVSLVGALLFVISFFSITIMSVISGMNSMEIMTQSSNVRLLMIVVSKIILIVVFYILSLNKKRDEFLINPSLIICFIVPLICVIAGSTIHRTILMNISYYIPDIIIYIISISYLVINIIIFILYEIIKKEADKNYSLMAKFKQYEMTEQHNAEILKIYSDMREWRHDYTNHMQVVVGLIEKAETNEAVNYIKNIDEKIKTVSSMVSTGNYIVDAIVSAKLALASSFNINFEYNISLSGNLLVTDEDLCAVLSNLLDNAIEACRKLKDGLYIELEIVIIKNQLHIRIKNSTNGEYKKEDGKFKTTKKGSLHGIGIKHVESIVEEYGGIYNIEANAHSFTTQISIPLTSKK